MTAVYPNVDNITAPFVWTPISDILGKVSLDCDVPLTDEWLDREKRTASRYTQLRDSIEYDGILDPIFFDPDNEDREGLGNGHHRLACLIDLGCTHAPTTDDPEYEWQDSGPSAREDW